MHAEPLARILLPISAIVLLAWEPDLRAAQDVVVAEGAASVDNLRVRRGAEVGAAENQERRWPAGKEWRLSAEPLLDIGVADGAPEYEFFNVRGAVRLGDGRIVVTNSGTGEIRFFDADGVHQLSIGGRGEGPGEFVDLQWVHAMDGDSIMAWDWRLLRLSVFDPGGGFVRSHSLGFLAEEGFWPEPILPGSDDRLLVPAGVRVRTDTVQTGTSVDSAQYHTWVPSTGELETVGRFFSAEFHRQAWGGGAVTLMPRPFGRYSQTVTADSGFYFSASDTYEIGFYDLDGRLQRRIRLDLPERRVTSREVREYREGLLAEWESRGSRHMAVQLLEDVDFPETLPALGPMRLDADGNLWVSDYLASEQDTPRWRIFTSSGELLGSIETPARFTVHDIGRDYVLGSWRNPFDLEHVQLYRLIKP